MRLIPRAVFLTLLLAVSLAGQQKPPEVLVMTSGAFTAAHLELAPRFEAVAKQKVVTLTTTMGSGNASIPNRLGRGEPADVVIVAAASLDELIRAGVVLPATRTALARSSIAMAVRKGAPKPDISTPEALKRTLLAATSVAYSSSVSGRYLVDELFPRLGIAAEMAPKSRPITVERVGAVVARGEAELGFQQLSELKPIEGIAIAGLLPGDTQRVSVFAAGVASSSPNPAGARAYIEFLVSRQAAPTIAATGLEPVAER